MALSPWRFPPRGATPALSSGGAAPALPAPRCRPRTAESAVPAQSRRDSRRPAPPEGPPPEDSVGATPRGGKRHGDSAMVTAPWRCHSALITARGDGAGGDRTRGGSAGAAARGRQREGIRAGPAARGPARLDRACPRLGNLYLFCRFGLASRAAFIAVTSRLRRPSSGALSWLSCGPIVFSAAISFLRRHATANPCGVRVRRRCA